MNSSVMVKLIREHDSEFIAIRTYDREHGGSGRFLLSCKHVCRMMFLIRKNLHCEMDCGNVVEVEYHYSYFWLRLIWLSHYEGDLVRGYEQLVKIPSITMGRLLMGEYKAKVLYSPGYSPCTVNTTHAGEVLKRIQAHGLIRRAFIKAMRDSFRWRDDTITLYPDGKYSFFFTTESGFPKNGGLILHSGTRNGYFYYYYSVHT